ncbi:MAG: sugar phosphate nucleotidyltransferase [Gemmatimonadota bacterium]|nr:sugar phosphate nucleotidyltransferase [Gemmatimonadota bacterium]
MNIWSVVLAGGVGSRFWPMSTPECPKQLLPLVTDQPMLSDTLNRLTTLAPPERTLILTNATLREQVAALAPLLPAENIIPEPQPAGTCAALAWAAHTIAQRDGRDAVMVCVHADWSIADVRGYRETLALAAHVAESRKALVTVGIVPVRPDPGFGYIRPGETVSDGVYRVEKFEEKPERARAAELVADGCLWNSGIFAWRVGDLLDEIHAHTPEVAGALDEFSTNVVEFFANVKAIAVDVGVLERSSNVLVLPGSFGWDDVGTWSALRRVRTPDHNGNTLQGRTHVLKSGGNVVYADGGAVVLYGVEDLVVVARAGLVLVTTIDKATDLKALLDSLPADLRGS